MCGTNFMRENVSLGNLDASLTVNTSGSITSGFLLDSKQWQLHASALY